MDDLEQKVQKTNRIKTFSKKLFFQAIIAATCIGTGMYLETNNQIYSEFKAKRDVKEYLIDQELEWKKGTDRQFYKWKPHLVVNTKNKTIYPELIKIIGKDTISAGPIYKDGRIGYTLEEEIKKEAKKEFNHFKEKIKDFRNKIRELYLERDSILRKNYSHSINDSI